MKRYLTAFALLVCLGTGVLIFAHLSVNSHRDQVEVREEVLYGDREAAQGLTVGYRLTNNYERTLTWHTRFTLGEGEIAPETDFAYKPEIPEGYWDRMFTGTSSLGFQVWNTGMSGTGTDLGIYLPFRLYAPAVDVAGRTNAGERRTETVSLADYYDSFLWDLADGKTGYPDVWYERINEMLEEWFRLPVQPGFYLRVSIAKNSAGAITRVEINQAVEPGETVVTKLEDAGATEPGDDNVASLAWPDFITGAAFCVADGEEGIYLYPSVRNEAGEELIEYKEGPGVYLIPRLTEDSRWVTSVNALPGDVDMDGMRLVYATGAEPLYMRSGGDGKSLLLYGEEDGRLTLTVIDTAAGQARQKLDLLDMEGRSISAVIDRNGLILTVLDNGELVLVREQDGACEAVLRTQVNMDFGIQIHGYDYILSGVFDERYADLAWDGTRLAVANYSYQTVLAADEAGMEFLAWYDYGPLWDYQSAHPDTYCYGPPMTVKFS